MVIGCVGTRPRSTATPVVGRPSRGRLYAGTARRSGPLARSDEAELPGVSRLVLDPLLRTDPPLRDEPSLDDPDPPRGAALRPVASPPPLGRDCPLLALLPLGRD